MVFMALAVVPMTVFLVGASPSALAAPKGIFSVFEQCPTGLPGVALCQDAEITSGEFAIGSMRVPIDRTIVLQGGGVHTGGPNPNEFFGVPATNGENISKTPLDIPGGMSTLIDCDTIRGGRFHGEPKRHACRAFSRHHRDDVSAIVEPAASLSHPVIENLAAIFEEEGTALVFPVRLHLENPMLGEACYIGSETSPIVLNLTNGTTNPPPPATPIKGNPGELTGETQEGIEMLTTRNSTLLDNTFTVPTAEGCARNAHLASIIDKLIDQTLGLESPPGHNTAILTGTHRLAATEAVLASEQFPDDNPPPPASPTHHPHHHWWWSAH
jgi:hypothetical protein